MEKKLLEINYLNDTFTFGYESDDADYITTLCNGELYTAWRTQTLGEAIEYVIGERDIIRMQVTGINQLKRKT